MRRLHSEDGQALVFVAMVGLLIFMFFSMSTNVAEIVQTKIKERNTADAAAVSGAVWQARVLNTVSAMNQEILDNLTSVLLLAVAGCQAQCCGGWCEWSPLCRSCKIAQFLLLITLLNNLNITFEMQEQVLHAFGSWTLLWDVQNVMELNHDFKPNTADIDTELFTYLHENNGNMFLINGASGRPEYVLERGGWCETLVAFYYSYCRRGMLPGCSANNWPQTLGRQYSRWINGQSLKTMYSSSRPVAGGGCFGSNFHTSPMMHLAGGKSIEFLHLYVLHTFDPNTRLPLDPEELIPVTDGVYRVARPPLVHLWAVGSRDDLECKRTPILKENWFPCTSEGAFGFSMAHAYSDSVAEFYRFLYDSSFQNGMNIRTPYPVPLAPTLTDWEARLFPLEPLQDEGGISPYAGVEAFDQIARQVGDRLGSATEIFLRQNVLMDPEDASPDEPFFLY